MTRALALLALLLAACRSSAPYTLPAAVLNTGLAVGAAAAQRSAGGCYAVCVHGTVCNPRTGLCEPATADTVCEEAPGGGTRCVPLGIVDREASRPAAPPPIGISPATGSAPPPPAESSPRGAP